MANAFGVEMVTKKQGKYLEPDSNYSYLDADGDGIITDKEMAMAKEINDYEHQKKMRENEDKKEDQIRAMAWFALWGMLLYPFAVVLAIWLGLDQAGSILGDMAAVYFVSVAAIVAAFYGKEALAQKTTTPKK